MPICHPKYCFQNEIHRKFSESGQYQKQRIKKKEYLFHFKAAQFLYYFFLKRYIQIYELQKNHQEENKTNQFHH